MLARARQFFLRKAGMLCLAVFLVSSMAMAQGTDTALLRGTVMDSTGAVIPGATVSMTNVGTNVAQKRTSDESGRYIFNDLKPAAYTVRVEAAGFKALVRDNIVMRVGQQSDLDLTLEIGEMTQTVEVQAASPLLNTVSGALGTEVTGNYIMEMPLMDRDIASLSYL
ncbi:MAG: hypothetical protein DMG58_16305, partial [Acidobacteria bacterium]